MTVGNELRQARQRAGLSSEQVSQETKIQLAKIDALEDDAFERLPDGIYLDGIVRAYARTVGLDEAVMVQRVRDAVDRGADAVEDVAAADDDAEGFAPVVEASAAPPIAYAGTELRYADIELYEGVPDIAHDRGPAYLDTAPPGFETPAGLAPPPDAERHDVPPRRTAPLILVVLAFLAASAAGGYLFEYSRRALSATAVGADDRGVTGAAGAGDTGAAGDLGAAGVASAAGPGDTRTADARASVATTGAAPPDASAPTSPVPAPAAPVSPVSPVSPAPAAPESPVPPVPPVPPVSPEASASADVSGVWALDTRIESSSVRDYQGLQLGYRLELQQDGARVTGTGVKTVENGRTLGSTAQTPITFHGTVEGERLTLTFVERGLRRTSDGKMILSVNDDGVLRGRFSSSAAQSVGIVEARRAGG